MRALMTAGPALDRCHVGGYNCSYVPVDSPRAFDETMYILMCGTGVGFSVERHNIEKLPVVNEDMHDTDTVIKVGDSRPGWAKSMRELISLLYAGQVPQWDTSEVRPAGASLKTLVVVLVAQPRWKNCLSLSLISSRKQKVVGCSLLNAMTSCARLVRLLSSVGSDAAHSSACLT